jgi:hypothetical protein
MTPDSVFQYCSTLALLGWIVLIVLSPIWIEFDKAVIGVVIALLALVYCWLIFQSFDPGDFQKFGSLNGVMELFSNKTLVTAGWVHYLAFDLLTGCWIKKNATRYNISHWIIIPCLLLTFMLGPAGLLVYLLVRFSFSKKYFASNY